MHTVELTDNLSVITDNFSVITDKFSVIWHHHGGISLTSTDNGQRINRTRNFLLPLEQLDK